MKSKTVTFRVGTEILGVYSRPRRLLDGRWSEGSAPTARLRQMTREALKLGLKEWELTPTQAPKLFIED